MRNLRQQVDRIDLKILKLLQQRTKLSGRIGETKRRHHADIYVPERERELLARMNRLNKGKLPAPAVSSIYREILSSSRAAQGQAPIAILRGSETTVLLPARWCFGACDGLVSKKTWAEIATGLKAGALTVALLTGQDLADILRKPKAARHFLAQFTIAGEISPLPGTRVPLGQQIFIVVLRGKGAACSADRILILIECKSTVFAVKSLLNSMPDRPLHADELTVQTRSARSGTAAVMVHFELPRSIDGIRATGALLAASKSSGVAIAILGVYPGPEHGG